MESGVWKQYRHVGRQTPHRFASSWWLAGVDGTAGAQALSWRTPHKGQHLEASPLVFLIVPERVKLWRTQGSESRRTWEMFPEPGMAPGLVGEEERMPSSFQCQSRP